MASLRALVLLCCLACGAALRLPAVLSRSAESALSRRAFGAQAATGLAALALGSTAAGAAEEPSRMGGILEPYVDAPKGFKLLKPSGWNKFDVDPGVYEVKFQDLIEPFETVQVSTSPVATATSVDALGELQAVGEKFAKGRDAELIKSQKRSVGDVLTYTFELKGPVYHELLLLSINKGKLYRMSCISRNQRWDKRKEMFKNIALSFVPQGF